MLTEDCVERAQSQNKEFNVVLTFLNQQTHKENSKNWAYNDLRTVNHQGSLKDKPKTGDSCG